MSARMDRLEFYREAVALGSEYVPGDWRWALVAAENGKTIGASTEGYRRRIAAVRNAARGLNLDSEALVAQVASAARQDRPVLVGFRRGIPLHVVVTP